MAGREEEATEGSEGGSGSLAALVQTGDRIATALEKLATEPQVEIEAGPPICPNCGEFNPVILLASQEAAQGKMAELVIDATCVKCEHSIYIVIESYSVHSQRVTAAEEIKERERIGFFNGKVQ